MLLKTGVNLSITKVGSLDQVLESKKKTSPAEVTNKRGDFIYFAAKSIAANIPNGNGDWFPWDHLLKSYATFVGRNLFLNHNSDDPRNAIGKVIEAYPVEDAQTGEKYIECVAKIDAVAHPDLARQIEAGILDSVSMGCAVESSTCSVCGHTIYSDQDKKCHHLSKGLLKEYVAEVDLSEYGIEKGKPIQAFAINRGLNFTELSVVNVPAWNNAKIVQVIAQLKERIAKAVEAKQNVSADMIRSLEDLLTMTPKTAESQSPETSAPTPTVASATSSPAAETKESRLKKLFSEKLSALEYLDLLDFVENKKAKTETPVVETIASSVAEEKKDASDLAKAEKLVSDVKKHEEKEVKEMADKKASVETPSPAPAPTAEVSTTPAQEAKKEDKKDEKKDDKEDKKSSLIQWKEQLVKLNASAEVTAAFEKAFSVSMESSKSEEIAIKAAIETLPKELLEKPAAPKAEKVVANYKAIFVSKPSIKESYWVVTDSGKPILKATLGKTWQDRLSDPSIVAYASSAEYGDALLARLSEDGVNKVAALTNAILYVEAEKDAGAQGKDLPGKPTPPAQRGQVGPNGGEWPSEKSVGRDEYTPAAPSAGAKMKKTPDGVDMSGGAFPGAAGPTGGKGAEYPTQKSMGSDQYKHVGGGGPKAKTEKASSEDTSTKVEVTATATSAAPVAVTTAENKTEVTVTTTTADNKSAVEATASTEKKAEPVPPLGMPPVGEAAPPADMGAPAPTEAPKGESPAGPGAATADMSDEQKLEHMCGLLETMAPGDKLKKPLEAVRKALERLESAMTKQQEADAKAAEKEEAAAKKAEEKAKKEEERAAKEEKKQEKAEAPKEEVPANKKEDKKESAAEPAKEVAATPEVKTEVKAEVTTAETKVEAKVEATPQISERERQLESELARLKLEQSFRVKVSKARVIAEEMLDKGLISPDEKDVQELITAAKLPLFDARAAALQKAIDKQCSDLLKMDDATMQAFAQSIRRIQKTASFGDTKTLKRSINLPYNENMAEDTFLKGIFGLMGSQKGK